MAASARIDELRHRYAAQPRRYLAPLADALRQTGSLEEAVTMLRAQLAEYPDHLTGHVVLGHALFDTGALADAQTAFEAARALDPGNRVVLRQLGEIASLAGDRETARLWFERLRAAEPYADDVAAQLGGGATGPPEVDDGGGSVATIVAAQEVGAAAPAEAFVPAPFAADGFELLTFDAAPLDPVVGLDVPPADTPAELQAARHESEHRPIAGRTEVRGEDSSDDAAALDHITAGPFATETMAGLLAAQGHTGQAIALYERLTAERPADVALRGRLDALRGDPERASPERSDPDPDASDAARGALLAAAFADVGTERAVAAADFAPADLAHAAPVPGAEPPADATPSDAADPFADVSFDRFFVDASVAPAVASGDDADLARFDAWLRDVTARGANAS